MVWRIFPSPWIFFLIELLLIGITKWAFWPHCSLSYAVLNCVNIVEVGVVKCICRQLGQRFSGIQWQKKGSDEGWLEMIRERTLGKRWRKRWSLIHSGKMTPPSSRVGHIQSTCRNSNIKRDEEKCFYIWISFHLFRNDLKLFELLQSSGLLHRIVPLRTAKQTVKLNYV